MRVRAVVRGSCRRSGLRGVRVAVVLLVHDSSGLEKGPGRSWHPGTHRMAVMFSVLVFAAFDEEGCRVRADRRLKGKVRQYAASPL